ncbi:insulinase family protein, partial [bacterium]|nr:insulinase family protein [bacterium]
MSFQYINPQNLSGVYNRVGFIPNSTSYNQYLVPQFVSNPFDASFYNQNTIYPYNPLFNPVMNNSRSYSKVGILQAPNGDLAHIFKLSSGQNVAIVPKPKEATIVKTFINTGSITENDKISGSHHFKEHSHFLGSSNFPNSNDVFRLTGLMGASTNASTDYAKVDYYITAPFMDEDNFKKTIELQGDMLSRPLFNESSLESEKGPVCSEISMINDDATTEAFDRVIRNLFQIQSESENLVAGSIDTVQKLTAKDLKTLHDTYYTPKNITTVVVGDVDVDKTIDLISKNFIFKDSGLSENLRPLNPIQVPKREDIRSSKTNYTSVFLGFSGPASCSGKDFIIARMIDFYLSNCSTSLLKSGLEKMSGSYESTIQKVSVKQTDPNAMISMLTLNPSDEQKGLDLFYDAIQKLQNFKLTDDELNSAKIFLSKNLAIDMSNSESVCDFLGECLMDNSENLFTNYKDILNSITKEDIMDFARKYYDLPKVSVIVVHPTSVSENQIQDNYLKSKYSFNKISKQNPAIVSFTGGKKISTQGVEEYIMPNNTHLAINDTNSELCVFNWSVNTPPIKP